VQEDDDDEKDVMEKRKTGNKAAVALALKRTDRVTIYSRHIDVTSSYTPKVFPKNAKEAEFLKQTMKSHFIFEELGNDELQLLVDAMECDPVEAGTKVLGQDEKDEYFYIIEQGAMDIFCEVAGISVGHLDSGEVFGEASLLYDCNGPSKSIVAEKDTKLWRVDHTTFRHVLGQHAHQKDQDIRGTIKKVGLFQSLNEQTIGKFANFLTRVSFEKGDRIVEKGDIGEIFYIIEEGSVKVHDIGIGDSQSVDQMLGEGDWFGERALLTGEARAANVTALSNVTTLAMDRDTFEKSMGELHSVMEHREKLQSLKALPCFANSDITEQELAQLANLTYEMCYAKGQKLAQAGKPYQLKVWVIRHGRLLVYGGATDNIYALKGGDHFGDKSVLTDDPNHLSTHDAVCEENLTTWVLSKEDIESIVGDIRRLGKSAGYMKTKYEKKIRLRDLKKHRILGQGAFGRVWLAESNKTKTPYALKMINKRRLLDSHQEKSVIREKEMLSLLQHPFILYLVSSFEDEANIYLVLPLVQGGELFNVLQAKAAAGKGISNNDAAFYSGCIIEALSHFHHRHIAYRDLKLENVMIDAEGYGKIVDLGFAKVVVDKTYTFCGTPEYLAPEIIMSKGHDKGVDYWSFGVLLYELLVGRSPFFISGSKQMEMFKRIVMVKFDCPPLVNDDAKDLIQNLLVRRQADRLGNLLRGPVDIRMHPWFKKSQCHYEKLLKKQLPAPWVPDVKDPLDSSNFDDYSSIEKQVDHTRSLTMEEQAFFEGF
jgi:protein kinase A